MSEPVLRAFLLAAVALAVAAVAWFGSRRRMARPRRAMRLDLDPGIHLFSSSTCAECEIARSALKDVLGREFAEVRFEDDPVGFGRFGIAKVPTVIVVGKAGEAIIFEGVPRRKDLRRVAGGKWEVGSGR